MNKQALLLGALYRWDKDNDNKMHMYEQHGAFMICGFLKGKHVFKSYRLYSMAKKVFLAFKVQVA